MAVRVRCPNPECAKTYSVAEGQLGQRATCRKCGKDFRLGRDSQETAEMASPDDTCPLTAAKALPEMPAGLGRFKIYNRLGAGAFGVVYRAYDPLLDREVALKVPHAGRLESDKDKARFLREAKAAAKLRHPNIVPVYEAGVDSGCHYLASAFIEGQTLQAAIEDQKPDFQRAARLVRDLAQALFHAHRQGVVHRDIKPANIMLDGNDEPLVMDFGLARFQEGTEKLTHDGTLLGTPVYMPPEQAMGKLDEVGPASDQYSLGVVLYELLCGNTPFSGPPALVISHVINHEPPRPRQENAAIPRDLETVCLKAMAKRPQDRYTDCQELAEDLHRWLTDEPIRARHLSPLERAGRWARRNPAVAGLSASAVLLLALVTIVTTVAYTRTETLLRVAQASQRTAEAAQQKEAEALRQAQHEREAAIEDRDAAEDARRKETAALEEAKQQKELAIKQRDIAEDARKKLAVAVNEAKRQQQEAERQRDVAEKAGKKELVATREARFRLAENYFDRGSQFLDHGDADRGVLLLAHALANYPSDATDQQKACRTRLGAWMPTMHKPEREIQHPSAVLALAVSPDGSRVASGCEDGKVRIWDLQNGKLVGTPLEHRERVSAVLFSGDGEAILSGSADGTVNLWNLAKGTLLGRPMQHPLPVNAVAFSPDGKILATASGRVVQKWRRKDLTHAGNPLEHEDGVALLAFSPEGKSLLTATAGPVHRLQVWNATTGQLQAGPVDCPQGINALAFHPAGTHFATANKDYTAKIWNFPKLSQQSRSLQHQGEVLAVAFSQDGKYVVTGCADQTARIWRSETGEMFGQPLQHRAAVTAVVFIANGSIVTGSFDAIHHWRLATGGCSLPTTNRSTESGSSRTLDQPGTLTAGAFASTGTYCALATKPDLTTGLVRQWNCMKGEAVGSTIRHVDPVLGVALSPDGQRIATAVEDAVQISHVASGERAGLRLRHKLPVHAVVFSKDGSLILTGGADGIAQLWETSTGNAVSDPLRHGPDDVLLAVALSPDHRTIATGTKGGLVWRWDVQTQRPIGDCLRHHGPVRAITFCAGGTQIATGSEDRTVRLWNAATGESSGPSLEHPGVITAIAASPEEDAVLSGCDDGVARLWDLASGKILLVLPKHAAPVLAVGFHREAKRALALYMDQTIRLFPLPSSTDAASNTIVLWAEVRTGMELDRNGQPRKMAAKDWQDRVRQVQSLETGNVARPHSPK